MPGSKGVVDYILTQVKETLPLVYSYKYRFGSFHIGHPLLIGETPLCQKDVYNNDYEAIYGVSKIVDELRILCPSYSVFYDDINAIIHVRVKV